MDYSLNKLFDKSNYHYIITKDIDLNGDTINIPEKCIIEFKGGTINNGKLVCNSDTKIINYCGSGVDIIGLKYIDMFKIGEGLDIDNSDYLNVENIRTGNGKPIYDENLKDDIYIDMDDDENSQYIVPEAPNVGGPYARQYNKWLPINFPKINILIQKTYKTYDEMINDKLPVNYKGELLRNGEVVSLYNSSDISKNGLYVISSDEAGNIEYVYQGPLIVNNTFPIESTIEPYSLMNYDVDFKPSYIGQIYVKSTEPKGIFISTGTSNNSDWVKIK